MKLMALEKQMEMFEDGGLKDEGGTVDPVSGNDVPPGSTQEEVRDDIPAQLSEGEFVMPADVVRFHGLDKMMALRDEAKMGLARMEAMGQMGNSDEATLPDDIPFTLIDLEIVDEDDKALEMQVGGFVPQQQPYGVVQQPAGQNVFFAPSQFQQPIAVPYGQQPVFAQQTPVTPIFGPGQPTGEPKETFTFGEIMPTVGGTSETREYRNASGESLYIPFINGEPIYPIPEGYTYVDPEATQTEEVTTAPATPETTSVRIEDADSQSRDEARQRREEEMYGPGSGRLSVDGVTYGVSFDMPEGFIPGIGTGLSTAFSLAAGKPLPEDVTVNFKRDDTTFRLTGTEYNLLKDNLTNQTGQDLINKAIDRTDTQDRIRAVTDKYAEALSSDDKDTSQNAQKVVNEYIKQAANKNIDKRTGQVINPFEMNRGKGTAPPVDNPPQDFAMTPKQDDGGRGDSGRQDFSGVSRPSPEKQPKSEDRGGRFGGSSPRGTSVGSSKGKDPSGDAGSGGYSPFKQGGLASKPKSKAKKMKRGGLASKK